MNRIYLDSCIVIYLVEDRPEIRNQLRQRLRAYLIAEQVYVSPLVRMECRVLPLRQNDKTLLAKYDFFFRRSGAIMAPINARVFELATMLRASYNIKVADSLHLAVAQIEGYDEFWTNDQRLLRATQGRIKIITPLDEAG